MAKTCKPDFLSNRFRRPTDEKPLESNKKYKEKDLKFDLCVNAKIGENKFRQPALNRSGNNCRRVHFQKYFGTVQIQPGKIL